MKTQGPLKPQAVVRTRVFAVAVVFIVSYGVLKKTAHAEAIYRCGNTYTNQPSPGVACEKITQANVTVIEGTQVRQASANNTASSSAVGASPTRVDQATQKQRDEQAQQVLQTELQKAQQQQALLQQQADEAAKQINQAHQDEALKAKHQALQEALERSQADVSALQRELWRASHQAQGK